MIVRILSSVSVTKNITLRQSHGSRIVGNDFFIPLNHLNMKSHEFSKTKERQKSVKNRSAMMTFLPDILLENNQIKYETS